MGIVGAILLFTSAAVQAQPDSGTSSGGSSTMGSGSGNTGESSGMIKPDLKKGQDPSPAKGGPDLTTPGKGGDGLVGGKVPRTNNPKVPDNSGAASGTGKPSSSGGTGSGGGM